MGFKDLTAVISIDEEKCLNCHSCIDVCPVMANNGSGDKVVIDHNKCIGCGQCIDACSHGARGYVDDFDQLMSDLDNNEEVVAIVAPAAAANFPGNYLKLNSWLKQIGVAAIFDVSFGAELTIKSYLDYIKNNNPECVIAQPCPAIVTYIQIYKPELLDYLAPVDSPMVHTIKMIKEYYSTYENYKVAAISPCLAKKREFIETGYGDYNVTYKSINSYFKESSKKLYDYSESNFDNPEAERAVLFSTPGGLLRTALREDPDINQVTRKIEGVHTIYDYLEQLPAAINSEYNPLLIDCLSCEMGCNGGPGTLNRGKSRDEIEYYIEKRNQEMQQKYASKKLFKNNKKVMKKIINKYWKKDLYSREYLNLKDNNDIIIPDKKEIDDIYRQMNKENEEDIKNCKSCGYGSCEQMAVAVYNNLNKVDNCHWYQKDLIRIRREEADKQKQIVEQQKKLVEERKEKATDFLNKLNDFIQSFSATLEELEATNETVFERIQHSNQEIAASSDVINNINSMAKEVQSEIDSFDEIRTVISAIARQTNLLALNASIEASRIGAEGRGFAVVSDEIRELAESSTDEVEKIQNYTEKLKSKILSVVNEIKHVAEEFQSINMDSNQIMSSTKEINGELNQINKDLENVKMESEDFIVKID
ncbi:MAG: [Fe-Fe] hydrogenase large subunit C-terminal domain-containing protein [Halothermotrichaceae bacterium]